MRASPATILLLAAVLMAGCRESTSPGGGPPSDTTDGDNTATGSNAVPGAPWAEARTLLELVASAVESYLADHPDAALQDRAVRDMADTLAIDESVFARLRHVAQSAVRLEVDETGKWSVVVPYTDLAGKGHELRRTSDGTVVDIPASRWANAESAVGAIRTNLEVLHSDGEWRLPGQVDYSDLTLDPDQFANLEYFNAAGFDLSNAPVNGSGFSITVTNSGNGPSGTYRIDGQPADPDGP